MQHKIKGRLKKAGGRGKGPLCNHAVRKKPGILPDFLFEDP